MRQIDMQTGISSIDIDKTGRHIAVGGREILKIIDIDQQNKNINIKWNLRRQGTKLAIGYVEFNKELPNYLLAGSVQGQFQIWDLEKQKEDVYKGHTSAIHRMNWQNAYCFISGGQDQIIHYYDYRLDREKSIFNITRNEHIRDVKFNINCNNYFMASTDNGQLEYFDIRKINNNAVAEISLKAWKQINPQNMIICLDWTKDNILASGSTEKEIKIWQVENHTEIKEKVNIQHVDGASHLRWHKQNNSLLSVSSLNRDLSVTTYDIRTPFRPLQVYKGHVDTITTFVYDSDEQYLLTGSKDKILKMQSVKDAYNVYDNCPIYPVCFNQSNDLLFKLESHKTMVNDIAKQYTVQGISKDIYKQSSNEDNPIIKSRTQVPFSQQTPFISSQQDIYRATSVTPSINMIQTTTIRSICLIQNIDQQLDPKIPFEEEIKYFQTNYNSKKDFQYNSAVAQKIEKQEVAHYWKALDHLMIDFLKLSKEFQNVQIKCPVQIVKEKSIQGEFSDDDQKSPLEQSQQNQKNKSEKKQLEWQDLQKLYKYFEKYPAAFRQEQESKNIIIDDKSNLKIHPERIPYYKNLLRTMTPLGQLLTDKQQMIKVISNSILQLIQHVIDQGELQSGFWMAACAKNFVTFPDYYARKWTLSFIELLVAFGKNSFAMKAVLESPVEQIRKSNQYNTNYKCIGPCKMSQANTPYCSTCRTDIFCSICFKPVKGLYLWCQKCMHGGHMKEMKEWFKYNTHCPMGCGDICFEK